MALKIDAYIRVATPREGARVPVLASSYRGTVRGGPEGPDVLQRGSRRADRLAGSWERLLEETHGDRLDQDVSRALDDVVEGGCAHRH